MEATLRKSRPVDNCATRLNKRENFRRAFAEFDVERVARFGKREINRLKIEAAINNAQRFIEVQHEFGSFDAHIWDFVNGKPLRNGFKSLKEIPAKTPLSDAISKDLSKRGFKFVGSTIVYAHMQATGMVNDHTVDCFRYTEVGK